MRDIEWNGDQYLDYLALARTDQRVVCLGCGRKVEFTGNPMQKCPHCVASIQQVSLAQSQAQTSDGKAVGNTGTMVALYPRTQLQNQLAVQDGEPAPDLHMTLAFLGHMDNIKDPEALKGAVADWAAKQSPMTGEIAGHGLFTAGKKPVTYVSPDVPGLPKAHADLIKALAPHAQVSQDHGFTPHITLAYADKTKDLPDHGGKKISFNKATLKIGDQRIDYPFGGAGD